MVLTLRVQQYVSARILEIRFFIRKEIRPTKEFTQTVRDNLVLAFDDIAVMIEFVDGIRITIGRQLIGFYPIILHFVLIIRHIQRYYN